LRHARRFERHGTGLRRCTDPSAPG